MVKVSDFEEIAIEKDSSSFSSLPRAVPRHNGTGGLCNDGYMLRSMEAAYYMDLLTLATKHVWRQITFLVDL